MTSSFNRIVGLDMLLVKALHLSRASSFAAQLGQSFQAQADMNGGDFIFGQDGISEIRQKINMMRESANACGLKTIDIKVSRLEANFLGSLKTNGEPNQWAIRTEYVRLISGLFEQVANGIYDELHTRRAMILEDSDEELLDPKTPLFGEIVADKFPEAIYDIEEAGKCLAFERYTSCVFHLMRAAEHAVSILADHLRAVTHNKHGEMLPWGMLTSNIEGKIKSLEDVHLRDRWLRMHTLLHSCNRAYRTKTAHPINKYLPDEAEAAMAMTRSFMNEAAELI